MSEPISEILIKVGEGRAGKFLVDNISLICSIVNVDKLIDKWYIVNEARKEGQG
jgi:hypothetical protein